MPTYVAFLRAINIKPRWVKMEMLRDVLQDNGFREVETHIQSGNVRFMSTLRSPARVAERVERLIEDEFGFAVPTIVRSPAQLAQIVARADAFELPAASAQYVTFLRNELNAAQIAALARWDEQGERLRGSHGEIYWWLDKSSHQAKISNARLERDYGVGTTRSLKVVREVANKWGAA